LNSRIITAHLDENNESVGFYAMTISSEPDWHFKDDPSIFLRISGHINSRAKSLITVNLLWVAVHNRLHRQGLGTLLMGRALDDFREVVDRTGVAALTLKPISLDAAGFYSGLGFVPYGQGNPKRMFLPAEDIMNS
jgi:GNAT superfamily N-acetyltransferase